MSDATDLSDVIFERLLTETQRQHPDNHIEVIYSLWLRIGYYMVSSTTFPPAELVRAAKKLATPVH